MVGWADRRAMEYTLRHSTKLSQTPWFVAAMPLLLAYVPLSIAECGGGMHREMRNRWLVVEDDCADVRRLDR